MKKFPYDKPFLQVYFFDQEDIVTESPGNVNTGAEGTGEDIFNSDVGNFV